MEIAVNFFVLGMKLDNTRLCKFLYFFSTQHIYIYTHTHTHTHIHIYIYIYILILYVFLYVFLIKVANVFLHVLTLKVLY